MGRDMRLIHCFGLERVELRRIEDVALEVATCGLVKGSAVLDIVN
jgi:hypothetical protein